MKKILKLQNKSRERKKQGLFVLEGVREIKLAIKGEYEIESLLFDRKIINLESLKKILGEQNTFVEITSEIYNRIAYRECTEGVIALVKTKEHLLENLNFKTKNPLVLVVEAPEKPGNIGAILRTADAAHVDAVIIANPKSDLYNPNIIRSSVGCVFTNTIAIGQTDKIISFLKRKKIPIYCAALRDDAQIYHRQNFKKSTAIVVGTEATGLSENWLKNTTQNIIIPMRGKIDSMNVSVATGILIFEVIRQRNSNVV